MLKIIQEKASELGLDALEVTSFESVKNSLAYLEQQKEQGLYPAFAPSNLLFRAIPRLVFSPVKSILCGAMSYKQRSIEQPLPLSGELSSYALGFDYHQVLRNRLNSLSLFLEQEFRIQRTFVAVDATPLCERALALKSGLGTLGKNSCVFVPSWGSFVFLGELLVDKEIEPSSPKKQERCLENCNLCVKACPTQALYAPFKQDSHRCLSYISQSRGMIPLSYRKKLGFRLWGCDTCQSVCPRNKKANASPHLEFAPLNGSSLPLIPLLTMTKSTFRKQFEKTPLFWRGKTTLQRNALIVCGNYRDPIFLPYLVEALHAPSPILRQSSAWALGQLHTRTKPYLEQALRKEHHEEVKQEILYALSTKKSL